jgi:hypothetical protein
MFLVTGAVSGLVPGLMVLFYLQTKATCLTIFAGAVRITAAVNANEGGDAKTFARQVVLSCVADR